MSVAIRAPRFAHRGEVGAQSQNGLARCSCSPSLVAGELGLAIASFELFVFAGRRPSHKGALGGCQYLVGERELGIASVQPRGGVVGRRGSEADS